MNREDLRKKLDTGTAYFMYCVILMVVAIVLVLTAHIFTNHGIIAEIIAAFLAAIITAMITRVLLRQQTQSNFEMVEKQSKAELEKEYRNRFLEYRHQNNHKYLETINKILEDGNVTEAELLELNICLQHIILEAPYDASNIVNEYGDDYVHLMRTRDFEKITQVTNYIISSVVDATIEHKNLYEYLFQLTKYLAYTELGPVDYAQPDVLDSIVGQWTDMYDKIKSNQ